MRRKTILALGSEPARHGRDRRRGLRRRQQEHGRDDRGDDHGGGDHRGGDHRGGRPPRRRPPRPRPPRRPRPSRATSPASPPTGNCKELADLGQKFSSALSAAAAASHGSEEGGGPPQGVRRRSAVRHQGGLRGRRRLRRKVADAYDGQLKPGQTPDRRAQLQKLQKLSTSIDHAKLTAGVAEHHRLGHEELPRLDDGQRRGRSPRRGCPRLSPARSCAQIRSAFGTRNPNESAGSAGRPATSAQTVIAIVAPRAPTIASHVQPGRSRNRTAAARKSAKKRRSGIPSRGSFGSCGSAK